MLSLHWHRNRSMLNESRITDSLFARLGFPCGVGLEPDRCFQVEVDQRATRYFWSIATKCSAWIDLHSYCTASQRGRRLSEPPWWLHRATTGSIINWKCYSWPGVCAGWRFMHCEQPDCFPCVRKDKLMPEK